MSESSNPLLVTGGAGFIGSSFVRAALAAGRRVVDLDALTYAGNPASLEGLGEAEGHLFVHGSINDRALVDELLSTHEPTAIVNFAAESHVDRSLDSPADFVRTNIDGTFMLLEAARAYRERLGGKAQEDFRFLHVSTDEVYGAIETGAFREDSAYAPNSPYAASKAAADHLVRAFNKSYGLPTLITNCGNNYGPRQFPEKLIPLILLAALEEKPLPVYGDGGQVRDWLHVEDHCRALLAVLQGGTPGETYLIGGAGGEQTNLSVVRTLCGLLDGIRPRPGGGGHADLIAFVPDRPGHDRRYAIDAGKIGRELGWRPEVAFEDGLARTIAWYLDNRAWWEAIQDGGYRGTRQGLTRKAAGG